MDGILCVVDISILCFVWLNTYILKWIPRRKKIYSIDKVILWLQWIQRSIKLFSVRWQVIVFVNASKRIYTSFYGLIKTEFNWIVQWILKSIRYSPWTWNYSSISILYSKQSFQEFSMTQTLWLCDKFQNNQIKLYTSYIMQDAILVWWLNQCDSKRMNCDNTFDVVNKIAELYLHRLVI